MHTFEIQHTTQYKGIKNGGFCMGLSLPSRSHNIVCEREENKQSTIFIKIRIHGFVFEIEKPLSTVFHIINIIQVASKIPSLK